jgi:hypothetical protein
MEEYKLQIIRQQDAQQNDWRKKSAELRQWLNQQIATIGNLVNNFSHLTTKEKKTYLRALQQHFAAGPEEKTLPPVSLPSRSRLRLARLVAILLVTIGLALWPQIRSGFGHLWQQLNYRRIYETAYPHPSGIYLNGDSLWISDWQGQSLYRHNPKNFALEKIYYLNGRHLTAITGNEKYLYAYDSWNQTIYQIQRDGYLNILKKIAVNEIFPQKSAVNFSAIAAGANYLWASDITAGRIYQIDLDRKKLNATFPVRDPATGIAVSNGMVWLLDGKNYRVVGYTSNNWQLLKSFTLPDSYRKNFSPTALAVKDGYFWVVSEKECRIYRYALRT